LTPDADDHRTQPAGVGREERGEGPKVGGDPGAAPRVGARDRQHPRRRPVAVDRRPEDDGAAPD
jgi:hypothetical protein